MLCHYNLSPNLDWCRRYYAKKTRQKQTGARNITAGSVPSRIKTVRMTRARFSGRR